MDDEFPLDHGCFTIVFPCFIVRSEDEVAFVCHPQGDGEYVIAVLTDEDSLNSYRLGIGLPERGAVRFTTVQQLLAALQVLPPQVTCLAFDLHRRRKECLVQSAKMWKIDHVRRQLAAQIPQG